MPDQARIDAHRKFAQQFGKNLFHARKEAGISQEELGLSSIRGPS